MPWYDDAVFTNPTLGTVLADTGPIVVLSARLLIRPLRVYIWTDTACEVVLEHRDVTNTTTKASQNIAAVLGRMGTFVVDEMTVLNGERLRVTAREDTTGLVQVSIATDSQSFY